MIGAVEIGGSLPPTPGTDDCSADTKKVGSIIIREDYRVESVVDRNPQYAWKVSDVLADKGNRMDLTPAELIVKYPQIEVDMAALTSNP